MTDPALVACLEDRLPGTGAVQLERLVAGHSNITYTARRQGAAAQWIVRTPPPGPLPPGAHDVLREHRVLAALAGTGVRAPQPVAADGGDTPFFAMERLRGEVVRDTLPSWLADHRSRRELLLDLVDALAELHEAPIQPFVDARLGRTTGYLERQLERWSAQWTLLAERGPDRARGHRLRVGAGQAEDWLRRHRPPTGAATVVHGDTKLDNALVDPSTARVVALLDWEMATVGEPLSDLGFLIAMTPWAGQRPPLPALTGDVTTLPGFPSAQDVVEHYARRTGRDVSAVRWFVVLGAWKTACLLENSLARHHDGQADDPFFQTLVEGVPRLLEHGLDSISAAGLPAVTTRT